MSNRQIDDTIVKLQRVGLIEHIPQSDLALSAHKIEAKADDTPWFLQLFLGFSGLVSGLLLIGFFFLLMSSILDDASAQFIISIILIGASFGLFKISRSGRNTFLSSLAFALSIAGQGFLCAALFSFDLELPLGVWLFLLVQAALIIAMPNFVHRLLSSFIALGCLIYLLSFYNAAEVSAALLALITSAIGLNHYTILRSTPTLWRASVSEICRATSYASALMLLTVSVYIIAAEYGRHIINQHTLFNYHYPLAQGLLILASVYATHLILRRYRTKLLSSTGLMTIFAISVLGMVSVYVSGLLATSLVIVIAMANSQRVLMGLGILALVSYVCWYYYQLDTSLLLKAGSMLLIGVGILIMRWLLVSQYFNIGNNSGATATRTPPPINREETSS